MTAYWVWTYAIILAGLYCIVRGISDMRARRYGWGSIGLLSGIMLLTVPVPTHAVKIDLPIQAAAR